MRRRLLHISVPEFPVTVERVANPSLRNRPVAVATSLSGDGRVIVSSHEASRESVFPSLPVAQAVKRCPGLVVLPWHLLLLEDHVDLADLLLGNHLPQADRIHVALRNHDRHAVIENSHDVEKLFVP